MQEDEEEEKNSYDFVPSFNVPNTESIQLNSNRFSKKNQESSDNEFS